MTVSIQRVGIFGSWRPKPTDNDYLLARETGKLATAGGWQVLTGGYSGVMEAASRGSVEAGGRPVGVTCPEIDRLLSPNQWVRELQPAPNLVQRQAQCLALIDAAIFFPGRTGTAAELAQATELRAKGVLTRPLILVSSFWEGYFAWLAESNNRLPHSSDEEPAKRLFVTVSTAAEAIHQLMEPEDADTGA